MRGYRVGNLLELGIQLRCQALVGHPWCQSILDEQWCGRDARCGRVMFKKMPDTLPLLLQVLLGWTGVQFLELEPNPEAMRSDLGAEALARGTARRGLPKTAASAAAAAAAARPALEEDVPVWQQVMHVYHIPASKHMLGLITSCAQYALLVHVAPAWPKYRLSQGRARQARLLTWLPLALGCCTLSGGATQPLSVPSEAKVPSPDRPKVAHFTAFDRQVALRGDLQSQLEPADVVLCFWLCSPVLQLVVEQCDLALQMAERMQLRTVADSCVLLTLVAACTLRVLLARPGPWWRPDDPRDIFGSDEAVQAAVDACRILMALSAVMQSLKLLQRFFVHKHVGVLITAVFEMVVAVGRLLGIFLVVTVGCSVAFEILLHPSAEGVGLVGANNTDPGHTILYEDDPEYFQRWSIPWFAIYGHISQIPIHDYSQSALLAPLLLWLYMLLSQVGMLNLFIAVMTDTYFKVGAVGGTASASWRMSRVATNVEYIQRASVPEPFDVPILLVVLLWKFVGRPLRCVVRQLPCCREAPPPPPPVGVKALVRQAAAPAGASDATGLNGNRRFSSLFAEDRDVYKNAPLATRATESRDRTAQVGGTRPANNEKEYTEEQRARDTYLRTLLQKAQVEADDAASGTRIAQLQQTCVALRKGSANDRKLMVELRSEVRELHGKMAAAGELNARLERKLDRLLGGDDAGAAAAPAADGLAALLRESPLGKAKLVGISELAEAQKTLADLSARQGQDGAKTDDGARRSAGPSTRGSAAKDPPQTVFQSSLEA